MSSIDPKALDALVQASSGERGAQVTAFEKKVANYCGAQYAVAFNSGTSALSAAYWSVHASPYDTVITSPLTYIGTIAGALVQGAPIQWADIDPKTGLATIDALLNPDNPGQPAPKQTRGKKIIVPMHYGGAPCNIAALAQQITDPDTVIIEDGAHAFGALDHQGNRIGQCAYSDITVFSFHPDKTISTGEGGVAITNHPEWAKRMRLFASNGIEWSTDRPWDHYVKAATGNYRFNDLSATLGLARLDLVDEIVSTRRALVAHYRQALENCPHLTFLDPSLDPLSAHHIFPVLIDFEQAPTDRKSLFYHLQENEIPTRVHYTPLTHHPVCAPFPATCPNVEAFYARELSLPLYPDLSAQEIERIASILKTALTT